MTQFDIAVVGGGLAGSIAALALARGGRTVAMIAPQQPSTDQRTTALMDQSIRFMERLALWDRIRPSAAALSVMQILDGTNRLLRAPAVQFRSSEVSLDAFGYNIPNTALVQVLEEALAAEHNIQRFPTTVVGADIGADEVDILLDTGDAIRAAFVIGADGRKSKIRESAGIGIKTWSHSQSAIVLNFTHSIPHRNVSTEFHTESGPFTQVPLPGMRSSLVWVVKPDEAARMVALPKEQLGRLVEERMQSMLGKVTIDSDVQAWPLSSLMADRFGKGRVALIGEAAHAFPPIGAQGLNLSLRDVMTLAELLQGFSGRPIAADTGDRFDRRRRPDILSRTASVDLLNRSLLSGMLPVQMLRAAGLHLLSGIPPLRSLVMREGIAPGASLKVFPSLLKGKLGR